MGWFMFVSLYVFMAIITANHVAYLANVRDAVIAGIGWPAFLYGYLHGFNKQIAD